MNRYIKIFTLALPIVAAMSSHSLIGLIDIWLVGKLGEVALAAVGLGAFIHFTVITLTYGTQPAVQADVAKDIGEGRAQPGAVTMNTALLQGASIGLLLASLTAIFSPQLAGLLTNDAAVIAATVIYLQARAPAILGEAMIFAFEGYWIGVGQTRRVFVITVIMHLTNVLLSYALIFGHWGFPELGIQGAGLGTAIGVFIGVLLHFACVLLDQGKSGILRAGISRQAARYNLRVGVPASIQDLLIVSGWTLLLGIAGHLGTEPLAVLTVVVNLVVVVLLPGHGFGLACGSLAGWALGERDVDNAERWGWQVSLTAVSVGSLAGAVLVAFAAPVAGLFLHEPHLVEMALPLLWITAAAMLVDGIGAVLQHALQGVGKTFQAAVITGGCMWLVCLPISALIGLVLEQGLTAIWLVFLGYRVLQSGVLAWVWRQRGWANSPADTNNYANTIEP